VGQEYCCIYCQLPFGTTIRSRRGHIVLAVNWEHFLPYGLVGNLGGDENFVASCQVCNSIKRNNVFHDVGNARDFITERWQEKYEIVSDEFVSEFVKSLAKEYKK
jgi:5-methylcytosine-specific restriction endonuclease McrA